MRRMLFSACAEEERHKVRRSPRAKDFVVIGLDQSSDKFFFPILHFVGRRLGERK
jgi:hypothetical protein